MDDIRHSRPNQLATGCQLLEVSSSYWVKMAFKSWLTTWKLLKTCMAFLKESLL
jgi:hypothetical protein